jgi:hypothetical protein
MSPIGFCVRCYKTFYAIAWCTLLRHKLVRLTQRNEHFHNFLGISTLAKTREAHP